MQKIARNLPALCGVLTLFFAISPIVRACFRQPLSYNEGWNIYNALRLTQHQQLYPAHFAWTTNNYPMGSFVLLAALHRITGDFLFTGRAIAQISTILLSALLYFLLKDLGATRRASVLGSLFCFAFFATDNGFSQSFSEYTNAVDPEMLGLLFFVAGLTLYVRSKRAGSYGWLLASAVTFAVAFSIKHSPVAILVAVLIDALWSNLKRSLVFVACFSASLALFVLAQIHFGGPWFLHNLLEGRVYEYDRALEAFGALFLPGCIPLAFALAYTPWKCRTEPRRLLLILMIASLVLGFYFGSAQGVSINCFFGLMIAVSLSLGMAFSDLESASAARESSRWLTFAPLALFFSLFLPAWADGDLNPVAVWRKSAQAQQILDSQVRFVADRSGDALCENLLTCYLAGKPYVLDPFNATRLMRLGRLSQQPLVDDIQSKRFSSIEIESYEFDLVRQGLTSERFPKAALEAIQANYTPAFHSGVFLVYVPRT